MTGCRRSYISAPARLSRATSVRDGLPRALPLTPIPHALFLCLVTPVRGNWLTSGYRILHFIARHKRPAVTQLADADAIAAFKAIDEVVFIAYLGPDDDESAFAAVAARYRDEFAFGKAATTESEESASVVCYRLMDDDTVTTTTLDDPAKLEAWVREASRPVLAELTVLNRQRLLDVSTLPTYLPTYLLHLPTYLRYQREKIHARGR